MAPELTFRLCPHTDLDPVQLSEPHFSHRGENRVDTKSGSINTCCLIPDSMRFRHVLTY